MFSTEIIEAIKQDAIARFPSESCGVIAETKDGSFKYVAFENTAEDPKVAFHIDEHRLLPIMKAIRAVVHSHPNGPDCPSATDMRQQLSWNLPFGIVSTDGVGCLDPFFWGPGVPKAPLVGRGFRHGVTDCYSLIRDHFKEALGVELKEYPRDWEWWNDDTVNLYENNFEQEGFFRVEAHEVREHDCFLARLRSKTPNHAGVYVGNGLILHHLTSRLAVDPSRLSVREPAGGWTKFIGGFWARHESQR